MIGEVIERVLTVVVIVAMTAIVSLVVGGIWYIHKKIMKL